MPGPRLPMCKIRDVLRLSAAGMSKRKIAASLGVSATAAGECLRRARRAGLRWPVPEGLTDEALERRLYPPPAVAAKDRRPQPDWAIVRWPAFYLATRPLLTQLDRTARIEADDAERVLADINANYRDFTTEIRRHGVLLVVGAPCQPRTLAGQEHGRTIP
jgi:hypothetical protein